MNLRQDKPAKIIGLNEYLHCAEDIRFGAINRFV